MQQVTLGESLFCQSCSRKSISDDIADGFSDLFTVRCNILFLILLMFLTAFVILFFIKFNWKLILRDMLKLKNTLSYLPI